MGGSLSNKYSQKLFDSAKKSTTDAITTFAEATGDLIGNKIADKITKISNKKSPNNDEREENVEITSHKK